MPIHDWTRVPAGTFHDFHLGWIAEIRNALNGGILPGSYYARAEQVAGPYGPDVLTPQMDTDPQNGTHHEPDGGPVAVAPRLRLTAEGEMDEYVLKRRALVIRHVSGDRIVALLEIASPGNKSSRHGVRSFVEKAVEAIYRGFHLLVVDLFPPGPRDPAGLHPLIWAEVADAPFALPPDAPLTQAAYEAGPVKRACVDTTAVGRELTDMPLLLEPGGCVHVPLEATYRAAYRGVPQRWKRELE